MGKRETSRLAPNFTDDVWNNNSILNEDENKRHMMCTIMTNISNPVDVPCHSNFSKQNNTNSISLYQDKFIIIIINVKKESLIKQKQNKINK